MTAKKSTDADAPLIVPGQGLYPRVVRTYPVNHWMELRYIEVAEGVVVRGMFASVDIPDETLIEECPVVPIAIHEKPIKVHAITAYAYEWWLRDDSGKYVTRSALALGYGGVYNHSADGQNVYHRNHYSEFRMEWITDREVKAGEELVHDYQWGRHVGNRFNPVDRFLKPTSKKAPPTDIRLPEWPEGIVNEDQIEEVFGD